LVVVAVLAAYAFTRRPTFIVVLENDDPQSWIVHLVDEEDGKDMGWYLVAAGTSYTIYGMPEPTSKAYLAELVDLSCETVDSMGLAQDSEAYVLVSHGDIRWLGASAPRPLPSTRQVRAETCSGLHSSPSG
jgi:hypothetical protein